MKERVIWMSCTFESGGVTLEDGEGSRFWKNAHLHNEQALAMAVQWQCNGTAMACTAQWQKQCICSMKTCQPRSNQKGLVFVWMQYYRAGWDPRKYHTALIAA